MFIALDRFLAVFFPLRRPISRKAIVGTIVFAWILPCSGYSLSFHYVTLEEIYGKTYCFTSIQKDLLKTPKLYFVPSLTLILSSCLGFRSLLPQFCTRLLGLKCAPEWLLGIKQRPMPLGIVWSIVRWYLCSLRSLLHFAVAKCQHGFPWPVYIRHKGDSATAMTSFILFYFAVFGRCVAAVMLKCFLNRKKGRAHL